MAADRRAVPVPRPFDEAERLAALYRSRLLDGRADGPVEDLVRLAAQLTGMPIASLNLVDEHEQVAVATVGVPREVMAMPRDSAACAWTILQEEPIEIALQTDRRTRDVALFRRAGLQAYAAAPVRDRAGRALGALCVLDTQHHPLTAAQLDGLGALARQATVLLEWRLSRPSLEQRLARRTAAGRP